MSRKLFLHIGAQKTGTTSIQAALSENRLELMKIGFCYPEVEPEDPNKVSHYNSFRGFFVQQGYPREATSRFIQRVRNEPLDLIISAECLSAWPARKPGIKLHDLWARKRQIIGRIRESFPDHDAKVILFTRSAPDFLQSLYGQHLKVTKKEDTAQTYDSFLSREGHLADFASEIQAWQSAFNDVAVIDYNRITSSVESFCEVVGLPKLPDRRENVTSLCS